MKGKFLPDNLRFCSIYHQSRITLNYFFPIRGQDLSAFILHPLSTSPYLLFCISTSLSSCSVSLPLHISSLSLSLPLYLIFPSLYLSISLLFDSLYRSIFLLFSFPLCLYIFSFFLLSTSLYLSLLCLCAGLCLSVCMPLPLLPVLLPHSSFQAQPLLNSFCLILSIIQLSFSSPQSPSLSLSLSPLSFPLSYILTHTLSLSSPSRSIALSLYIYIYNYI